MDQTKIGKFIAACRKKENLTQMQLAEKGVTQGIIQSIICWATELNANPQSSHTDVWLLLFETALTAAARSAILGY